MEFGVSLGGSPIAPRERTMPREPHALLQPVQPLQHPQPALTAQPAPHPLRVLVVDDSAMLRRVLQRGVERGGHVCLAAGDGVEALEVFDRFRPDVVISDWEMPRMDGPELCRRVRERAADSYPYFIFLTALDQREHILTAMAAGADDYLEKPLDPHALQAALVAASRVTDLHARLRDQRDDLERLNLRLHADARRDPLTGLGNRLLLRENLGAWLERPGEAGAAVAMCDIDLFKRLNDRNGHVAGDAVLEAVAATIRDAVRGSDSVYRYGGEEFLVLLPNLGLDAAVEAVERIRQNLAARAIAHPDSDVAPFVTLSCGVAHTRADDLESARDWIHRADEALYVAKAGGRDRVERSLSPGPTEVA
jgi:two-component system cell cycle response regulator